MNRKTIIGVGGWILAAWWACIPAFGEETISAPSLEEEAAPTPSVQSRGERWTLEGRVGYNIGAATPIGIPNTIRKVNSFSLTPNVQVGLDVHYPIGCSWGVQAGLRLENKGMDVAVTTKGYHMAMVKGGEELEGVYTGRVEQQLKQWMLTVPVTATLCVGHNWRLKAGPYMSFVTAQDFSGNVSNGYLRKDTPTGQKIEMGDAPDERATYDFSDDMRRWQVGLTAGAAWLFAGRWGLSADLSWGLTGIMKSSFKTVEQTLYPIYGTIALTYQIK